MTDVLDPAPPAGIDLDEEPDPRQQLAEIVVPRRQPRQRAWRAPARRWLRRAVLGLVVLAALVLINDRVVGRLLFAQRQQHLASSFQELKPAIESGDAAAVLQIERLGINRIVVEGAGADDLRGGPGHLTGSALPGDAGMMVVLGHRDGYGGPFARLAEAVEGDVVVVQARNGPIVGYRVSEVRRHASLGDLAVPDDVTELSYLVLVTSERGVLAGDQIIVVARALPLGDVDPVVPDLRAGMLNAAPLGVEIVLGNLALAAALLAGGFLRDRASVVTRSLVVAPMAAFGLIRLLMAFDALLSATR